jgi:serine/threonine-protein kinase
VIHRDIKPENILLHDGRPVVADFGIALAVSAAAGGRMTETGLSLGSPYYMSPEQATADKEISARSDVYSLGSVLYEMLAGQPPYIGGSAQQIIMKIIAEEPVAVTRLRKSVPPNVSAAVAKALEKLPADRFESARQFAEALVNPAFTHGVALSRSVTVRRPWIPRAAGIAVAAVLVTAAVWGWSRSLEVPPPANLRLLIDFPEERAPIFQPGGSFALSPDGTRLAYMGGGRRAGGSGTWRLWIRSLDRLTVDSVPGSEEAHSPAWSSGGDSLVFAVGADLRVFSTLPGGGVATIRRGGGLNFGLAWSRGGILFTTSAGLLRIDPSSGKVDTLVVRADSMGYFSWPYWLDADRAATVTTTDLITDKPSVALVRFGGRSRMDTLAQGFNGQLLSTGDLLWAGDRGTVYIAPVDVERGRLSGGRTQLLAGVQTEPGMELRVSVSRRGDIVYALAAAVRNRSHLVVVNRRTGERSILPSPPGVRLFPDLRLSPDGKRLAVSGTRDVNHEIWLYQLATNQVEAFTVDGTSYNMAWRRNGDELTYCSFSPLGVWTRPTDKRLAATRLGPMAACPRNWTPDGKTLLLDDPFSPRIITLSPPDTVPLPLPGGNPGEFGPVVSPDGRWLAFAANRSGGTDVWVRGFRVPGGPWQVSEGGGFDPVWSRDGRTLFFRTDSAIVMAAVPPGDAFHVGSPHRVTSASSSVSAIYGQSFDVFPDGERLVLFESGSGASVEHLILETNLLGRKRKP